MRISLGERGRAPRYRSTRSPLAAAPQGGWFSVGSAVPKPLWQHPHCSTSQKSQHNLSPFALHFEWKSHELCLLQWNRSNVVSWLMPPAIPGLPPPFVSTNLCLWKSNIILQTVMWLLDALLAVIPGNNLFHSSQESFIPKKYLLEMVLNMSYPLTQPCVFSQSSFPQQLVKKVLSAVGYEQQLHDLRQKWGLRFSSQEVPKVHSSSTEIRGKGRLVTLCGWDGVASHSCQCRPRILTLKIKWKAGPSHQAGHSKQCQLSLGWSPMALQPRRSALSSLRVLSLCAIDAAFPGSTEVPVVHGGVRIGHSLATHPTGLEVSSSYWQCGCIPWALTLVIMPGLYQIPHVSLVCYHLTSSYESGEKTFPTPKLWPCCQHIWSSSSLLDPTSPSVWPCKWESACSWEQKAEKEEGRVKKEKE